MKYIRLLSPLLITLLAYSTTALAHDDVLPPPSEPAASALPNNADDESTTTNLHKELAPPTQSDDVEVRSYLREDDHAKITEYSLRGKVFRIKVQPPGGLPAYYLEDSDGDGTFNKRLPGGYKRINPPMWVIQQF